MTWEDIMRRVLPPIGGVVPHVTDAGAYGAGAEQGRKPPSSIPHRGVDFNYIGGKHARLNRSNPELRSPVAGIVTNAGEGSVGRIAIRDANGFSHEILRTQTQKVRRGDLVGVGQPIGTMGNTGTDDQHVHYQLKDPAGHAINPTEFWDRLGQAKSDPCELAYRDQYQQYLLGRDVDAANEFGGAVPSVTPTSRTNAPAATVSGLLATGDELTLAAACCCVPGSDCVTRRARECDRPALQECAFAGPAV
jgi:hypothetical protein